MTSFGDRTSATEFKRKCAGIALILILICLNFTLGRFLREKQIAALFNDPELPWWEKVAQELHDTLPVPPKSPGTFRFLYLSNSHNRTGGRISNHLQELLNAEGTPKYEIIDLSRPGLFMSQALQLFLVTNDFELDAAVLSFGYLSFSDRMTLSNQSSSARDFFRPRIFTLLSAGFWTRHFALGLYSDELVRRLLNLFRYRAQVRDMWEEPLASMLKAIVPAAHIHFLEVDEKQSWRFPAGFDPSLFNWSLYSLGRRGHLQDLDELLSAASSRGLPLLAYNQPIDWDKEPTERDVLDHSRFQSEVRSIVGSRARYHDLQDNFPVRFTTYDALHPTWNGARLHALGIALDMHQQNILQEPGNFDSILIERHAGRTRRETEEYVLKLRAFSETLTSSNTARRSYNADIFDLENAKNILESLVSDIEKRERALRWLACQLNIRRHLNLTTTTWQAKLRNSLAVEIRSARLKTDAFLDALSRIGIQALPSPPADTTLCSF